MGEPALRLTHPPPPASSRHRFQPLGWMRWLQDDGPFAELTTTQLKVLLVLMRAANSQGESWWARATIAKACGCRPEAVRRARNDLQSMQLIQLVKAGGIGGQRKASKYRVVMRWPRVSNEPQPTQPRPTDRDIHQRAQPAAPTPDAEDIGDDRQTGAHQRPPGGAPALPRGRACAP